MRLLSNQSSRKVSVQHPLSFIPLLSSPLHPTVSSLCSNSYICPLNQEECTVDLSLSDFLSTQAENMIAGQPAKHEMSGGSRLLHNPLIFKLDWSVAEYGSCSIMYKHKSIFFFCSGCKTTNIRNDLEETQGVLKYCRKIGFERDPGIKLQMMAKK